MPDFFTSEYNCRKLNLSTIFFRDYGVGFDLEYGLYICIQKRISTKK